MNFERSLVRFTIPAFHAPDSHNAGQLDTFNDLLSHFQLTLHIQNLKIQD